MNDAIMREILKEISTYANLIANIIVIIGAIPIFFWLKNRSFEKKIREIKNNLEVRKEIQENLREHADGYDRDVQHDIGIRLVYWKNYPWKLKDDGYKQSLYYDTNLDKKLYHGTEFLTNTGILVEEHIWYLNCSLYLGKYEIYIVDKSNQKIPHFKEIKQKIKLVRTLKYKLIINWDFSEKIEYEPIFYTKEKYMKKKLYEDDFFAQNYDDDGINKGLYFYKRLNKHNRVKGYRSIKYLYLIAKGRIIKN